ncbi:MAG: methyltransferase domain-containing protein [Verrucomicrobiota bacterium]
MNIYCESGDVIVDLGSQNVNGSPREYSPEKSLYIGLDVQEALGVDIVYEVGDVPLANNSVDACLTISCFEHDEAFWLSFLEVERILRPGGFFFINAPSNGPVHNYPIDAWRFYPDAGLALEKWASRCERNMTLVESGVCGRYDDFWCDFVAVFRKGDHADWSPEQFVTATDNTFQNIRRIGSSRTIKQSGETGDLAEMRQLREKLEEQDIEHSCELAAKCEEIEQLNGQIEEQDIKHSCELSVKSEEIDQLNEQIEYLSNAVQKHQSELRNCQIEFEKVREEHLIEIEKLCEELSLSHAKNIDALKAVEYLRDAKWKIEISRLGFEKDED